MHYRPCIVLAYFKEMGLPYCVAEFHFCEGRKWAFDFAFPDSEIKLALEVEGGIWSRGRHTRGKGFLADMEKYNEATCLGWKVLRCTPDGVCMLETVNMIRRAILARKNNQAVSWPGKCAKTGKRGA